MKAYGLMAIEVLLLTAIFTAFTRYEQSLTTPGMLLAIITVWVMPVLGCRLLLRRRAR